MKYLTPQAYCVDTMLYLRDDLWSSLRLSQATRLPGLIFLYEEDSRLQTRQLISNSIGLQNSLRKAMCFGETSTSYKF